MLIDARELDDATLLRADVCVIGAGAAGIAIARELMGSGLDVALVESGGLERDEDTHALYAGTFDGPFKNKEYCSKSRCRYFGGTTNRWTGTCRPFDDIDFEARPWVPHSGWPIRRCDLDAYYARAADVLGSPRFDDHRGDGQLFPYNLVYARGLERVVPKAMFRSQPIARFGRRYRRELRDAADVRVYLNANLVDLEATVAGTSVHQAHLAVLDGPRLRLRARAYVLATGGLENARLLLASNGVQRRGLGNQHGNVGRYYMDHARLRIVAHVVWTGPGHRKSLLYRLRTEMGSTAGNTFYVMFTPSHDMQRRERMLNCGMRLMASQVGHVDEAAGQVHRLASTLDLHPLASPRTAAPRPRFRDVKLYVEHLPNPGSRVVLDDDRDALGMRRIRVEWRAEEDNVAQIFRTLELFGHELGRAGRGRLKVTLDRRNPFFEQGFLGSHPMGVTRMAADPKQGVVDADCRVHGVENLFVAGSSVFPTGGFANPTLTLVALALRLADHLQRRL